MRCAILVLQVADRAETPRASQLDAVALAPGTGCLKLRLGSLASLLHPLKMEEHVVANGAKPGQGGKCAYRSQRSRPSRRGYLRSIGSRYDGGTATPIPVQERKRKYGENDLPHLRARVG